MADGVTRSPSRLCGRDGKFCCYGDALTCSFVCGAAICYFQQVRIFVVRVLSACVICILPHLAITLFFIRLVFFRSSYFSGGVFFVVVVLSYPVR